MKQNRDSATHYTLDDLAAMEEAAQYKNPYAAAALAWANVVYDHLGKIVDGLCEGLYNYQAMQYLNDAVEQLATAADWLPEADAKGAKGEGRGKHGKI